MLMLLGVSKEMTVAERDVVITLMTQGFRHSTRSRLFSHWGANGGQSLGHHRRGCQLRMWQVGHNNAGIREAWGRSPPHETSWHPGCCECTPMDGEGRRKVAKDFVQGEFC